MPKFENHCAQKQQPISQNIQLTSILKAKQFNQLQVCRPYPKTQKSIFLIFIVAMHFTYLINVFITYKILSGDIFLFEINLIVLTQKVHSEFLYIIISVTLVLKLIIIITTILDYQFYSKRYKYKILFDFIQFLRTYQRVLTQIDFSVSSIILIGTSMLALANFIVSVGVILFSLLFLENYCAKKDLFYIGSIKMYIWLKISVISGPICNFICLSISQDNASIFFFLVVQTILSFFVSHNYLEKGHTIYKNFILKWGLFIYLVLFGSILIIMWLGALHLIDFSAFLPHILLTVVILGMFFTFKSNGKKIQIIQNCNDLQLQTFYLLEMLDQSHYYQEVRTFIAGLITFHSKISCDNPHCFTNNEYLYDSKMQRNCQTDNCHQNRITLLKFYIKCKYEAALNHNPANHQTILNYCEFLYNQFNNIGQCLYWVKKINYNKDKLRLSAKIKLNGLIFKIKEDNIYFLSQIYGPSLQIENLIEAEQVNEQITKQTFDLLNQQMDLWKMLQSEHIDLSHLRSNSENLFERIWQNSQKWKLISNFVQQSKHWKHQYLCFALFLKNQKIKSKVFQQLDSTISDQVFSTLHGQIGKAISTIDLFDQNACCLHTQIHDGQIFIKRVSRYFWNLTGYERSQVILCNLSMIIPKLVSRHHYDLIVQMSAQGKFSSQTSYTINQVYIVNKQGYIVPVIKTYKEFVTASGELEYVCFLKKIDNKECVILCDENYQIQGLTRQCIDVIAGSSKDGNFLKCVNLLSLIPDLSNQSKFDHIKESSEESIHLPSLKSISFLKKIENQIDIVEKMGSHPVLCHQRSNNKSEGKYQIFYPLSKLQDYAISYQNRLSEIDHSNSQRYYQCIKKTSKKIKNGEHNTFNCQLFLNQVRNHSMHYFEVKLEKICSNKLKKQLHFSEQKTPPSFTNFQFQLPVSQKSFLQKQSSKLKGINNVSANIFIKEEGNEASQTNIYLGYVKYVWVGFFIIFLIAFLLQMSILYSNLTTMRQYVKNLNSTIQAAMTSGRLVNKYQLALFNISSETGSETIQEQTSQIKDIINSPSMREIVFDQSINNPARYAPNVVNAQNKGVEFDEIDFIYYMESVIQTLSQDLNFYNNLQVQSIHNMYMDYQFPAFNNFLNKTRQHIRKAFQSEEANIYKDYTIFFIVQTLILVISIGVIIYISCRFCNSMIEMVKIHCHFTPKDVKKIKFYISSTIEVFQNILILEKKSQNQKQNSLKTITYDKKSKSKHLRDEIIEKSMSQFTNLNKRQKKIIIGKKIFRQKIIHFVKISLSFSVLMIITFSSNAYINSLIKPIYGAQQSLSDYAIWIPTHYLSAQVMSFGFNVSSVSTFNLTAYKTLLSNFKIIIDMPYLTNLNMDDPLNQYIKGYFFNDICLINQQLLDINSISLSQCQSIANHSFQNGIREYSRYHYEALKGIMQYDIIPQRQLVQQFFRSIQVYHILNNNLINKMVNEYYRLTESVLLKIQLFTISMFMLVFFMIIFSKYAVFDYLTDEYQYYKRFYKNMMPEYIVSGEKLIKSKLIVMKFL